MSLSKSEIMRWLSALPNDAAVGIDEGGLTLVAGTDPKDRAYLEVGGEPEDEDSEGSRVPIEFKIDVGDSSRGPCGFVAYVVAETAEAALARLRLEVSSEGFEVQDENGIQVRVYLNPDAVTIEDVKEND